MGGVGRHPNTVLSPSCASLGTGASQLCGFSLFFFLHYFSFLQPFHPVKNKFLDKMRKQTFPRDEVWGLCPKSNKILPK